MDAKQPGRRRFLKSGAALAGLAVSGIRPAAGQTPGASPDVVHKERAAYGQPSRFEAASRIPAGPNPGSRTPLQDVVGIIAANGLHFVQSSYSGDNIDPRKHRLLIHGMVHRPLIFSLEDLKRLPSVSRIHFVECTGNTSPVTPSLTTIRGGIGDGTGKGSEWIDELHQSVQQTHGKMGCAWYTGVLLSVLLREAGVKPEAGWLLLEGAEPGHLSRSIPLAKGMDDVLVAYGQNGEAIRPEQGYPFRTVVPGFEGNINIKWLRRVKVIDQPHMVKEEINNYTSLRLDGKARWFQLEMPVKSVITFPSSGQRLPGPGFYNITGLAWSGRGAIRKVEVSVDSGRTWKDAQLEDPVVRMAWTRFHFPWTWNGEATRVLSRSTDEQGDVQPTLAEFSKVWGVNLEYWRKTTNFVNHFNVIQPWKINGDGSVQNAMLG
ncbi:MAG: sulfite dehydrogenase [Acidobacteria bacterium]|nr:sulfite dehydrogenase [Acidobacteriota bacterium]